MVRTALLKPVSSYASCKVSLQTEVEMPSVVVFETLVKHEADFFSVCVTAMKPAVLLAWRLFTDRSS